MTLGFDQGHASHDHLVHLYDEDGDLIDGVVGDVAPALLDGGGAVVIATAEHRHTIDRVLARLGIDARAAEASGRLRTLDAGETLARFMVDGRPDPDRFHEVLGAQLAGCSVAGRPTRAFGEMVALLWDAGNVSAAIELESLWNDAMHLHRFSLYCAYPVASLVANGDLRDARHVCDRHSRVRGPSSYDDTSARAAVAGAASGRPQLFAPVPSAVRAVRRYVTDALRTWGDDALLDDATIVASELAANAVQHARAPFRVSLQRTENNLRIAVEDASTDLPARRQPTPDAAGGYGLGLVAALSSRWGTAARSDGKTVWADLPTRFEPMWFANS